jgi:hypothetical protein
LEIHFGFAQAETLHDQVGYWLWEPAMGTVIQTLSRPRGQKAMAVGRAAADARTFGLEAVRSSETNGIVPNPFLEYAFRHAEGPHLARSAG